MTFPGHDEKGRFTTGHNYGGDKGSTGRPEVYTESWVENELTEMIKWMGKEKNLYFKRFCLERGYLPKRLYEAVEKYPRFADHMEIIHGMQECKWVEGSTSKRLAEGICKSLLARMGVLDNTTTVLVKSDPVAIAVNESMGTSKSLLPNDNSQQSA